MGVIQFPSSTPLCFPHISSFKPSGYSGKSVFFPVMVGQINIWGLISVCFFLFLNKYICFERNLISKEIVIYHSKFDVPLCASKVTQ